VYVFRWRQPLENGKSLQRKIVLGTVKELSKTQAQKKADVYRKEANTLRPVASETSQTVDTSLTVAELVEHYKNRKLGEKAGKSAKVLKSYLNIFANYILPKWGDLPLRAVKAVAVEDWLKTFPLANGSKAKIREVFGQHSATQYVTSSIPPIPSPASGSHASELLNLPFWSLAKLWQSFAN